MKLYTEEQAEYLYYCGKNFEINGKVEFNNAKQFVTPIQLPSDEEIHNEAFKQTRYSDSFIRGAKMVINKIQGGNNEPQ